ncbi:hypothetical protein [Nostoc sp.]|uniref:hypothetical protein n=1 Tax=Nostoc sp. TaxID=1180 RepID=UPI002FF71CA7
MLHLPTSSPNLGRRGAKFKIGVAEQWDELGQAGEAGEARGEFWKLLNHPATMQRPKSLCQAWQRDFG